MTNYLPEDYAEYRLQRAKETLLEIETLIENNFWNTAISRMYYACFYAVGALMVKYNVKVSTHAGIRQQFGKLFVKEGKFDKTLAKHYTELFEKRNKSDYNDFFDYDEATAKSLFPPTREFIQNIEELLKLN
jgi:uncharacterized protein (UPF0332 family)